MLKIKELHDGSWMVYNTDNPNLHTHCRHKRIAIEIKSNVEHHRLPTSRNLKTLYSHIRVTSNRSYIRHIEKLIEEVKQDAPLHNKVY